MALFSSVSVSVSTTTCFTTAGFGAVTIDLGIVRGMLGLGTSLATGISGLTGAMVAAGLLAGGKGFNGVDWASGLKIPELKGVGVLNGIGLTSGGLRIVAGRADTEGTFWIGVGITGTGVGFTGSGRCSFIVPGLLPSMGRCSGGAHKAAAPCLE